MSRFHAAALTVLALSFAACSNKLDGNGVDDPRVPNDDTDDEVEPDDTDEPVDTDDEEPVDTDVEYPDEDEDGYTADVDCDDSDPEIHPGADERCNGKDDDCDEVLDDEERDVDDDGVRECQEVCPPADGPGLTAVVGDCEYVPSPSGTPFEARVEWNMTHAMVDPSSGQVLPAYAFADYGDYTSVFQAPAVGQLTDDDGDGRIDGDDTPDIVVVMANVDETDDGVLRLIAGDGSDVLASTHYQRLTNRNGTHDYAPYHYAGVATGNIDTDAWIEIVTLVRRASDGLCYPAIYEVQQVAGAVDLVLTAAYPGANYSCMAHAPAVADLEGDGTIEVIFGRAVFRGTDLTQKWYGTGGRGWYGQGDWGTEAYWNSGYHAFAYDVDGDGARMEVVAGKTVYNSDGTTFCELGAYYGSTWYPAVDGYPAIADIARYPGDVAGEPEIVVTGNEWVAVYHGTPDYDPNGLKRCLLVDELPNDPLADPTLPTGLPAPASCDATATSFGGPPTVADFDGDGQREIGVAGSCWYSVFELDSTGNALSRRALTNTRDWSSASTGSTVFDFNGDGTAEIVFSDEQAVYVWSLDTTAGLKPWQRLQDLLVETSHKSWTIHEYPLVADVDNDGKAEIVAVNSHLPPDHEGAFGIYVLGAADDDWVSARPVWHQHAYHITNVDDDWNVGACDPNYYPYETEDYNSFRQQAPGQFGALQASNLEAAGLAYCQEGCGDLVVRAQVANDSAHVTVDGTVPVGLYGVSGNTRTFLLARAIGADLPPGSVSAEISFVLPPSDWQPYDRLEIHVDDPEVTGFELGAARECDETDNIASVDIEHVCP